MGLAIGVITGTIIKTACNGGIIIGKSAVNDAMKTADKQNSSSRFKDITITNNDNVKFYD